MTRPSKLSIFKENGARVDLYKRAIRMLLEAGVEDIMIERAAGVPVDPRSSNALQVSAFAHQQSLGYQAAVMDMFDLLEIKSEVDFMPSPDFGSRDRLRESGYDEDQLGKLDRE